MKIDGSINKNQKPLSLETDTHTNERKPEARFHQVSSYNHYEKTPIRIY